MRPGPDLIRRYSGRGPRYTSYPPVPAWAGDVDTDVFLSTLAEVGQRAEPMALYTHLPFCAERCWYCACNVVIQHDSAPVDRYLDHLAEEVATRAPLLTGRTVNAIHVGGGTPNFLTRAQMSRLVSLLRSSFTFGDTTDMDIEVDPRQALPGDVAAICELGFNRVSFGVQDLNPDVGEAIGRVMELNRVADLAQEARQAGVHGINIDLMYGLPRQTDETFRRTLSDVIETIRPDRLAIYGYAHVPWMRPKQKKLEEAGLPDTDARIRLFQTALGLLAEAGFAPVGLDHFAKPTDALFSAREQGTLDRGFQGYTTVSAPDLLGLGASAISFFRTPEVPVYAQNATAIKAYERSPGNAIVRGHRLTPDDVLRGRLIRDVLCGMRVRHDVRTDFPDAWGGLTRFEDDGLVVREEDGTLSVTELGRYFLRPIAMLLDAGTQDKARYSAVA